VLTPKKEGQILQIEVSHELLGKEYLFGSVGYGDELSLHFGERIKFNHPNLKDKTRGTYVVTTRASSWALKSFDAKTDELTIVTNAKKMRIGNESIEKHLNPSVLETGAFIAPKSYVSQVIIRESENAYFLDILFSDGSQFSIIPLLNSSDSPESEPVEDWELFGPDFTLKVGPNKEMTKILTTPKTTQI